MSEDSQITEIRALLPWYVNNTLSQAERTLVETELAKNKTFRAELAWLKSLQKEVKSVDNMESKQGLEKLMQQIALDRTSHVAGFSNKRSGAWLKPAFAVAATVLIVQTFVMSYLLVNRENLLQPLSGPSTTSAVLQITFRPSVTEQQLRELLAENQAEIVSGPGALGVYGINIPQDKVQRVITALQNKSDIVESVQVIKR